MEEKAEEKRCPFFNVCGASIIRDKIQGQKAFEILVKKKVVVSLPKWSDQFCFNDFKNCVHYKDRIRNK